MKKLDANQVAQLVANAGKGLLDSKELKELLGRIKDLLPDEAPAEEKAPPCKKQYVILISDPQGKLNDFRGELAGWVLQIPESESARSTEERLHKAAYDFNATRRGRKMPVQTIGETIESVPAKELKEVELWVKTKSPVLMLTTRNEIPNTPSLFGDEARGITASEQANVTTRDGRKVTPTAMLDEINAKFAEKLGIKKEGE